MFTIDLANTIFVICVAVGGVLLLITVLLDDILGGVLDSLHVNFDVGGVTLMPLLLGFISMFGVGGLFGTEVLNLGPGQASIVGGIFGLAGAGLVFGMFRFLGRSEAPPPFTLTDLVGERGRVSVTIGVDRLGSVLVSHAGSTHSLGASADEELAPGTIVEITDIYGSTVVVRRASPPADMEGTTDA
jgi:membrane protein implicated in regulation of membrane protease activity